VQDCGSKQHEWKQKRTKFGFRTMKRSTGIRFVVLRGRYVALQFTASLWAVWPSCQAMWVCILEGHGPNFGHVTAVLTRVIVFAADWYRDTAFKHTTNAPSKSLDLFAIHNNFHTLFNTIKSSAVGTVSLAFRGDLFFSVDFSVVLLWDKRVYPKVSELTAWRENCKWYSSLPLDAVVSLFCESV
jgi:hypothetical protein